MTFTATAEVDINAPAQRVWQALTDPEIVEKYFFGTHVETDWKPGSPITWSGEYDGTAYQDKGSVIDVQEPHLLRVTHFSPMTGLPDKPENYHTLTYELTPTNSGTRVKLSQDNNASADEANRAEANWNSMLSGLKKTVEG
ncbi:SRPBCC family protein [Mycobacterium sp. IS-1264]|uniref:SRPBCC family protein n=1 Tax=Mycobacterium sp. IS-1264 TaxID=1834158 RepID=UPI00096D268F|nr:SRPBCC family protein [Mycobacterium sp. IS-1264]OMC48350.1 ATPase [Mycobacterium sp. IS-1264]